MIDDDTLTSLIDLTNAISRARISWANKAYSMLDNKDDILVTSIH